MFNPASFSSGSGSGAEIYILNQSGLQEFSDISSNLYKSFQEDDFNAGAGVFWKINPSLTAAASYGRAVSYNVDWPFANFFETDSASSLLTFDMHNTFSIDAASVSLSVRSEDFSIGASAHFYFVEQNSAFPVSNPEWSSGSGLAAYQLNYMLDGTAFGFNLGISYQINEDLKAGAMVRSGYKSDLEGEAQTRMFSDLDSASSAAAVSAVFEMPWVFGAGFLYSWSDNLSINIDFQYSLWASTQENMDFTFNDPVWQQNLGSIDPLTGITPGSFLLAYDNSIDAGIGMEYFLSDISLRFGYKFSQSPNSTETYNLLFPAVDNHTISFGVGYKSGRIIIDAALAYSIGVTEKINSGNILPGEYTSSGYLPSVTLRYHF
jgi:long-subunit fatty acid transport protein